MTEAYFEAYEIEQVVEYADGNRLLGRSIEQERQAGNAVHWRLYGHVAGVGVIAIGDFKTRKEAEEVRAFISAPMDVSALFAAA